MAAEINPQRHPEAARFVRISRRRSIALFVASLSSSLEFKPCPSELPARSTQCFTELGAPASSIGEVAELSADRDRLAIEAGPRNLAVLMRSAFQSARSMTTAAKTRCSRRDAEEQISHSSTCMWG